LLFFGPNKLSDVAKSLGRSVRNFKNSMNEIDVEAKDIQDDPQLLEKQKRNQK
jgi:TatA/E family protein of Tat protein translocase